MKNNTFCCVFNRSDETILLEHILHHHQHTITLRFVKVVRRIELLIYVELYVMEGLNVKKSIQTSTGKFL